MAKRKAAKSKDGVNKSKAIREALKKNPAASPKDIATELTSQGILVSPAYVSIIKSASKKKRTGKRTGKRNVRSASSSPNAETVVAADLVEAKKLVDRVGGIEQAESLLGTLKKLR